jgi:uncharacterized protein YgiM (DUF1202 family)
VGVPQKKEESVMRGETKSLHRRWAACRRIGLFVILLPLCVPAVPAAEQGYVDGLSTYPLRDEPQFSAEPTERLPVGQELTILETSEGWVKVRIGNRTGWMSSSVVGKEAPANIRLGPLQNRLRETESSMGKIEGENLKLLEENAELTSRVTSQAEDLEKVLQATSASRNAQKLRLIALGGGLVIFGWLAGYALAATVHRRKSAKKYIID